MRISDVNAWVIFVTTILALLSGLIGFAWKLFRKLDNLLELPAEVVNVKQEIKALRTDIRNTNRESLLWRREHLRKDHGNR